MNRTNLEPAKAKNCVLAFVLFGINRNISLFGTNWFSNPGWTILEFNKFASHFSRSCIIWLNTRQRKCFPSNTRSRLITHIWGRIATTVREQAIGRHNSFASDRWEVRNKLGFMDDINNEHVFPTLLLQATLSKTWKQFMKATKRKH